jgi:hypothetical protein
MIVTLCNFRVYCYRQSGPILRRGTRCLTCTGSHQAVSWRSCYKTLYVRNLWMSVYVPIERFQPSLIFASMTGAYPNEAPNLGRLPTLPTKTRQGWEGLPGTNTLTYCEYL